MDESRPRPAPWLIKALKKRVQVEPPIVTEEEEEPEPAECGTKNGQLFGIFEQLEEEPQKCGT